MIISEDRVDDMGSHGRAGSKASAPGQCLSEPPLKQVFLGFLDGNVGGRGALSVL